MLSERFRCLNLTKACINSGLSQTHQETRISFTVLHFPQLIPPEMMIRSTGAALSIPK